jgi:aminoglycoside phosphotransferase (APT) family kinase protein
MDLIASGRDAHVFAYADGLVLRRDRHGRPAHREAGIMRTLLDTGYPVPAVHGVSGADMLMERIDGPTLAEAMLSGRISVADGAAILASLHDRLHAIGTDDGAMVHLDLHPLNVILAERGPVVIDWTNARSGAAGLDVAMTSIILAQLVLVPGIPAEDPETEAILRSHARLLLSAFLTAVADSPAALLEDAMALRRSDPNQSDAEVAALSG